MKTVRSIAFLLCICLVTGAMFSSCNLMPVEEEVMPPPISQQEEIVYKTEPAALGSIQLTTYCLGSFKSTAEESLAFELDSGVFSKFYVMKGDMIKKGALIAEVENDEIQDKIKSLEDSMYRSELSNDYSMARLKASLDNTKANVAGMKDNYSALQKELEGLESTKAKLDSELAALEALTTETTNPDTGVAYTEEEIAVLIAAKQAEISEAQSAIASMEKEVAAQKKSLASAQTNLNLEQQNYNNQQTFIKMDREANEETLSEYKKELVATQIFAPFDGKITFLATLMIGDNVNSDIPVATIADPSDLQFIYSVTDEEKYEYFYEGREVEVVADDNAVLKGVIEKAPFEAVGDITEEEARLCKVSLGEDAIDYAEIGNMGSMTIVMKEAKDSIIVKQSMVTKSGAGDNATYYVMVLVDGLPEIKYIEVGIITTSQMQVTSGLEVGDLIITGTN